MAIQSDAIYIRVPAELKQLIKSAAAELRIDYSEFIRKASEKQAIRTLARAERRRMKMGQNSESEK